MLTREQFFAPLDLPREEVPIPALGGSVWVWTMTAGERDRWESEVQKNPDRDMRARLAVYTVRDAEGKPLFAHADIPALSGLGIHVLQPAFNAAIRLNLLTKTDIDELEKNSRPDRSASTG